MCFDSDFSAPNRPQIKKINPKTFLKCVFFFKKIGAAPRMVGEENLAGSRTAEPEGDRTDHRNRRYRAVFFLLK